MYLLRALIGSLDYLPLTTSMIIFGSVDLIRQFIQDSLQTAEQSSESFFFFIILVFFRLLMAAAVR